MFFRSQHEKRKIESMTELFIPETETSQKSHIRSNPSKDKLLQTRKNEIGETFWRVIPIIFAVWFCTSLFVLPYISHIYLFCGFAAADWQLMVKSFWQRGFPTTVASEVRRSSFITVLEINNDKIVTHTTMTRGRTSAKLILKNWIIRDLFHPLNSTCLVELFMR